MTNLVEVTSEDIKNGDRRSKSRCAIALALKRKFPNSEIIVDYIKLSIDGQTYWTSKEMFDFQENAWMTLEVKPFTFDLDSLERPEQKEGED